MYNSILPKKFKRIVCLHSVSEQFYTITKFKALVKLLRDLDCEFISLEEIVQTKKTGRFISFTFDDGYLDNFISVQPFLVAQSIPATIFICPSFLKLNGHVDNKFYSLYSVPLGNWYNLNEWIENGLNVGYHTLSHNDLSVMNTEDLEKDFDIGLYQVFKHCNLKLNHFAFPFGHLPEDKLVFEKIARKHGIENAFTVNWGEVDKSPGEYWINRVVLGDSDSIFKSILKISGKLDLYYQFRFSNNLRRV